LETLYWCGVQKLREKENGGGTVKQESNQDNQALYLGQFDWISLLEQKTHHNIPLPTRQEALKALIQNMSDKDILCGSTSLMIIPNLYEIQMADHLITNFHAPDSTLMLLVAAFLGSGHKVKQVYEEAQRKGYKFLSYGDSCFFSRPTANQKVPPSSAGLPNITNLLQQANARSTAEHLLVDRNTLWHPYTSMTDPSPVLAVHSAQGCRITLEGSSDTDHDNSNTEKKTDLIDGMASWWSAIHGYRHPALSAAMVRQIQEYTPHVMFGGLTHRPAVALAEALVHISPTHLTKVFLADSGSVSVEVSLKMALQYQRGMGRPHKTKFLALRGAYHGDTLGAMSVCDPVNGMHSAFAQNLMSNVFLPRPPCDPKYSLVSSGSGGGCAGCTCHRSKTDTQDASTTQTYEDVLEDACVQMEAMVA
jgi:hypothetical protein